MISLAAPSRRDNRQQSRPRLAGVDLARAIAMLGMLVEHSLQYPSVQPPNVLWATYGRSAPLFVLLAGMGVSLATRPPRRPWSVAMIVARAPLLLLFGMVLSRYADGVILQSFALFFVVGACAVGLPRRALAALGGMCLVGGPLLVTLLRRHGELRGFGTTGDVGLPALHHLSALLGGLLFQYYPAVIWLGFFFLGMALGRADVSSAGLGRRLCTWAAPAAAVLFTVGWAGARAFGPGPRSFSLPPPQPLAWSDHWTTYGFTNAIGWALSSAALTLAVVGACIWVVEAVPRVTRAIAPLVSLGAMSLSFYVLQGLYLGTAWGSVRPYLTTTGTFFLASVVFWLAFAVLARLWLAYIPRGPFETVLNLGALILTSPLRVWPGRDRPTVPSVAPAPTD